MSRVANATILPDVSATSQIKGNLTILQYEGKNATFRLLLEGLTPNAIQSWHIHSSMLTSQNCTTAGAHYNPLNVTHGGPTASVRHIGDLGNFTVPATGILDMNITDSIASLYGDYPIYNRSVVIHANSDDAGLGVAATSLASGNAGPRVACGNIVWNIPPPVKSSSTRPGVSWVVGFIALVLFL